MQEERKILRYQSKNEKIYHITNKVQHKPLKQQKRNNNYEESINALIQYMKNHETNPSEKLWDQYAIHQNYLSSKTIGYLSGIGFNTLCRKKRKEINKEKRRKEG